MAGKKSSYKNPTKKTSAVPKEIASGVTSRAPSYGSNQSGSRTSFMFWDKNVQAEIGAHTSVFNALDYSQGYIQSMRDIAYRNAVLTDCDLSPFGDTEYNIDIPNLNSDNVLLPAGEAIASAMSSQKYVPMYITENGTSEQREKGTLNNQLLAGAFQKYKVHNLRHELIWDSLRYPGGGVTKTFYDGNDIRHERCFSWEIFVDPREARLGWQGVRTLYHRYLVDREKLYEQMKARGVSEEKLQAIWDYTGDSVDIDFYGTQTISDQIPFVEAYHLGTGDVCGTYFAGIRTADLIVQDYDKDFFPFSFLYQFHPGLGVLVKPFVSQQFPQQKFYDELTESTIDSIKKGGQPKAIIYGDSKPSIMYAGKGQEFAYVKLSQNARKPETLQFMPINPQVEAYRRSIPQGIAQNAGVPEQWVSGRVPQWLQESSGRAQQVAVEEGSKRMEPSFECIEEYFLDVGKKMTAALRDAAKADPNFKIPIVTGLSRKKLKVSDVLLPDDEATLIVHAANVRFRSPSAKYANADAWLDRKAISPEEWRSMQDMPDLQAFSERKDAAKRIIEKNCDIIRRERRVMEAFPTDNLILLQDIATQAANEARAEGEDDEVVQMLADYAASAMDEMTRLKAAAAVADPMGAQSGGQPPPVGGAPSGPGGGAPMGPGASEAMSGMAPGQMGGAVPTA